MATNVSTGEPKTRSIQRRTPNADAPTDPPSTTIADIPTDLPTTTIDFVPDSPPMTTNLKHVVANTQTTVVNREAHSPHPLSCQFTNNEVPHEIQHLYNVCLNNPKSPPKKIPPPSRMLQLDLAPTSPSSTQSIPSPSPKSPFSSLIENLEDLKMEGYKEFITKLSPAKKVIFFQKLFDTFSSPPLEWGGGDPLCMPTITKSLFEHAHVSSSDHHTHTNPRPQDKGKRKITTPNTQEKGKTSIENSNPPLEAQNSLENLPIPIHFDTICQGSVLEYKELLSKRHRAQDVLHKYETDLKENFIPNSLRINPPRVTINNENAQNILNKKLNDLTAEYRKNCTLALIEAQKTLAISFTETINKFPTTVEQRLQDIVSMLLDIPLHNLVTSHQWEEKLQHWKNETFAKFNSHLEQATLEFSIQISLEAKTKVANKSAQDAIVSKSMTMGKEKTINTLIDDGLKKIKNQVDNYLKPFLEKINKENPNTHPKNTAMPPTKNGGTRTHKASNSSPTAPTSFLRTQSFIPSYGQSYAYPVPPTHPIPPTYPIFVPMNVPPPTSLPPPMKQSMSHFETIKPTTRSYPRPSVPRPPVLQPPVPRPPIPRPTPYPRPPVKRPTPHPRPPVPQGAPNTRTTGPKLNPLPGKYVGVDLENYIGSRFFNR